MKTNIHLLCLAEFFSEQETFHTNTVESVKNTFYILQFFPRKPRSLWDNVEKYSEATDDNMAHANCLLET
jgi:hypothetical protein